MLRGDVGGPELDTCDQHGPALASGRGARDPSDLRLGRLPIGRGYGCPGDDVACHTAGDGAPWAGGPGSAPSRPTPAPGNNPSMRRSSRSNPTSAGRAPASKSIPMQRIPPADTPDLEGPLVDEDRCPPDRSSTAAERSSPGRDDDLLPRWEQENGALIRRGLQPDGRREDVRAQQVVDGLRLIARLQHEEPIVVDLRDPHVGADPSRRGEQQRPAGRARARAMRCRQSPDRRAIRGRPRRGRRRRGPPIGRRSHARHRAPPPAPTARSSRSPWSSGSIIPAMEPRRPSPRPSW